MRKLLFAAVILLLAATAGTRAQSINPHPRIWLTSTMLANVRAKASAGDPDYQRVKALADTALTQTIPSITIVSATNSNPVTFTTAQPLPWSGTSYTDLYIKGGTGAWAGVNNNPETNGFAATQTGSNTFTVPVDSSGFGSFSGQQLTVFKAGGETSGYLGYGYQGGGWQDALLSLSLVYKVTGSAQYATKALAMLDWINTLGAARMISPVSQDSGRADMATTFTVAITYDWLYDVLSSQQKAATIATLNTWNDWTVNNAFGRSDAVSNYWQAHVTATSSVGYATYGDNTRAQEWIDWANNQWTTYFAPKFFNAPNGVTNGYSDPTGFFYTGGLAVSGWNYGGNDISRHIKYMEMVRTATGTSIPDGITYAKNWAKALPYQLKPDRVKTPTWGRWTGDWYGMYTKTGPLLLSYFLSGTTEGAWAQWFYTHYGTYPGYVEPVEVAYDRLLFFDASRTATDYRLTVTPYSFSDGLAATVFWRSDWTDGADYSYFNASTTNATAELAKSAGHVDITRGGDYLLVQSNMWKGTGDGVTGTPSTEIYANAYGNTLFFWDGGAKCFNQDNNYNGCQTGFGIYKAPKVKLTSTYGFSENEFATAYDYAQVPSARTLQYFFRSYLALGNGVYVVWDRVQSTSASHTKQIRWQLSSASTPTVSNGVITSTVGSSKIFVNTLLPASANVSIVRNVNELNLPINWRAQVTDPAPAATYTGLTVINTTDASGAMTPATRLTSITSTFEGVQVTGAAPKVAILPKGVVANADGTFSSATYTTVSFSTTHSGTANYVVAGLAAGTYAVTVNGSPLSGASALTVDNAGVLAFNASAGSFAVTQTSGSSGSTQTVTTPSLTALSCSPSSVASGSTSTCTVTLSGVTSTATAIAVASDNSAVTVPPTVAVALGASSATFNAGTGNVSSTTLASVTATLSGVSKSAPVTVTTSNTSSTKSSGNGTYTCTNNQFVLSADITLANSDTVELVGSPSAHCVVTGNGHRFVVSDSSWVGHFRMQYADVSDVGTAALDILGGVNTGDYAYMSSNAYVDIEDTQFHRSSGFNLASYGNSSVTFNRNIYWDDNLPSVSADLTQARPWFKEFGTSTAAKTMKGNRIFRGSVDVASPNWTIGATRGCTTTCDADGNIMIGRRVGLAIRGTGSYVAYNFSHVNLDVTPDWPTWSQVANVQAVGAGVLVENNVFRSGHWVAQIIDGDLSNNVLFELHPHQFVRIGNGGKVHHNIMAALYPGLDRYASDTRLPAGDVAFGLVQTGNNLSIYNNTLDLRGAAVVSVLTVINGATVNSFRNNAIYRLFLSNTNCPSGVGCTNAIGGAIDYSDPTDTSMGRALYMDYNSFHYDPQSARKNTYNVGVQGKTLCQPGFGGNDLGTCPNASVDPQFRGPLPIATGRSTMPSVNDTGFPFNDSDIVNGVYHVSDLLAYFRWVYAPGVGSPLLGRQDPQDGFGDIGAIQTASLPANAPAIVATNNRPMVYAGPSLNLPDTSTAAKLSGYAADDALPMNRLTLQWSVVSGPGAVVFASPDHSMTTATFSVNGSYTVRLTADDGALRSTSDAVINVGVTGSGSTPTAPSAPTNVRIVQ